MQYLGIGLHQDYSHLVLLNQSGQVVNRARKAAVVARAIKFFSALEGLVEATWEVTRHGYWFRNMLN